MKYVNERKEIDKEYFVPVPTPDQPFIQKFFRPYCHDCRLLNKGIVLILRISEDPEDVTSVEHPNNNPDTLWSLFI